MLREAADDGRNLVVVTDDAYFGLFYGDDLLKESLFARLAGCHERILAVKVDGPTKEEFVWGFRTGHADLQRPGLLQQRGLVPGAGEEGRRRHPQRRLELLAPEPVGAGQGHGRRTSILAERQEKKKILEAAGRCGSARSSPSPSTPSTGSPIPSTPATSCA